MSATLTTLVSFNGDVVSFDPGDLIADANGDLFGATQSGGANDLGTVFEIVKTAGGYASTPTTLVSFNDADGAFPTGDLIADANGDLVGATFGGGAGDDGTMFEIKKTAGGYASTPTTLVNFDGEDEDVLVADANGDLFGVTEEEGGAYDLGTVFEIAKTSTGYASTPTTLVSFNGADGAFPDSLIADSNGDLFGTTSAGGAHDDGTVFEIVKTAAGYGSTPITLVSFNGADGAEPVGDLIADSNGDLFGTTFSGGANNDGTVFEIAKTAAGYASTPTALVSFNGGDGQWPQAGLIADVNGDLFGATFEGGGANDGTVFEIKKTAAGYASAPTTLISFNGTNGANSAGSLIADADGDLFGTTLRGGAHDEGTVFEITGGGFVTIASATPASDGILFQGANGQAAIWGMDGTHVIAGGPVSPNPGPAWKAIGTGDFFGNGPTDLLWQNTNSGQASIWEMDGTHLIGGGPVTPDPGPSWHAIGTGDFNHDGHSDILWQKASTGQASIWEMDRNSLIGGGPVSPSPGPAWKAIGTGDFNKDGFSDILWQNTSTGQVSIWEMSGNSLTGGGAVSPNPGPSWHAIGTGDFNDDGRSDILFQNANSGQVSIWEMNESHLIGGGPVSANPGPSWHAIGTGDFNGDGFSDILFQNRISGQISIWDMNGTSIIGGGAVSANPGPNWHAIGLT